MGDLSERELLNRLKEVRKAHDNVEGNPTLQYCLKCDEVAILQSSSDGLDCRQEHREHILIDEHSNAEIATWIDCLEYVLENE